MKIVQSFWSAEKDLTTNTFGWLSSQHHLMGWALSCLKLRAYYDDVHLYTDTNTKNLLIDYLHLPYTTVHTDYDHMNHYKSCLYALPKIMTYAAQDKPFIHVDGDVFIYEPFSSELENAQLIAQNFETGTAFNETIIKELRNDILYMPDYLADELNKKKQCAYNAGILGGNDLKFLNNYATKALDFVDSNCESIYKNAVPGNFNIVFEQTLFYALTVREKKEVTCYYLATFNDHGYTIGDFCDFTEVPYRLKYLHLIGGHKRNPYICDLMARTLLKEYPEYFYKIIALFKHQHVHYDRKITPYLSDSSGVQDHQSSYFEDMNENFSASGHTTAPEVFQFEDQLKTIVENWQEIPTQTLAAAECSALDHLGFFFKPKQEQLETVLRRNEHITIIEESFDWPPVVKRSIIGSLPDKSVDHFGLAIIPQLFYKGIGEVTIDTIDYNILTILAEPLKLKDLLPYLGGCFAIREEDEDEDTIYKLTLVKVKYLLMYKCLFIR